MKSQLLMDKLYLGHCSPIKYEKGTSHGELRLSVWGESLSTNEKVNFS